MTAIVPPLRRFRPGTTGWSAHDLDIPEFERRWVRGAYEIADGVLVTMPPAYYDGSVALQSLIRLVERYLEDTGRSGRFAPEADLILGPRRVARVDAVFLTPDDERLQRQANQQLGRNEAFYGRLRVVPTLVIESISLGHQAHDRETKRTWYSQARIPNYWILDAYERQLEFLSLEGAAYRMDARGRDNEEVRPALFPGLTIPLQKVWA